MLGTIGAIVALLSQLLELLKGLKKTPAEKVAAVIARVRDASRKTDETKGDTSEYEDVLRK
jgi:hypothetical protein